MHRNQTLSVNNTQRRHTYSILWGTFFVATLFVVLFGYMRAIAATPPTVVSYQGKLLESNASVTTTKDMALLLYDASTAGNLLYTASGTLGTTSTISVTPSQGIFSISLGGSGTNSLDGSIFQDNDTVYLEVIIDGVAMSPRKRLTAAPFAINSQYLGGVAATTTATSTYIPVSSASGTFTFSGSPQSSSVSGGVLYINPAAPDTGDTLFGIANNGSQRFRVDAEGDTFVAGTLNAQGDLAVTGTSTFDATSTFNSIALFGSEIQVSGAASFGDTLTVSGDSTFNSTSTFTSGIDAQGLSTFSGEANFSALATFATMTINGPITATNSSTFGGRVTVATAPTNSSVSGGVMYINAPSVNPDDTLLGLAVGGSERLRIDEDGDLFTQGSLNTSSTLTVDATTTLRSAVTVSGDATFESAAFIQGALNASSTLTVDGLSTFNATSTFVDYVSFASRVLVSGALNASSTLTVDGTSTLANGTLTVLPDGSVGINTTSPQYNLAVSGTTYLSGTTTIGTGGYLTVQGLARDPREVATLANGGGVTQMVAPKALDVQGDYLYVVTKDEDASDESALLVYNISDPTNPALVSESTSSTIDGLNSAESIDVQGAYAYIGVQVASDIQERAYLIVDITDPSAPEYRKLVRGFDPALSIRVVGQRLFLAEDEDTNGSVTIIDNSDPMNPALLFEISSSTHPQIDGTSRIDIEGDLLFVTSRNDDTLSIFDISDETDPILLSQVTSAGVSALDGPFSIEVEGTVAYITGYDSFGAGGFFLSLDISDPTNVTLLDSLVNTGTSIRMNTPIELVVAGDVAYVMQINGPGVSLVDVSDPSNLTYLGAEIQGSDVTYVGRDAVIRGGYLYISDDQNDGVSVLEILSQKVHTSEVGSARIRNLAVDETALFNNSLNVRGGLIVGGNGLSVTGDLGLSKITSSTSATNTISFSHTGLFFSNASSTQSSTFIFDTNTTYPSDVSSSAYILSVRNGGNKLFSVSSNGDAAVSGTIYAEVATIGTPGQPGDLAERVDITTDETVEPGDVMVIDPRSVDTYRKSSAAYQSAVAGVISTQPTIVVGNGRTENTAALAMVGRVPIKVSLENGPIRAGDLLVTASIPGYAMKFDPAQDTPSSTVGVVGLALGNMTSSSTGKVLGLVRGGWINSASQTFAEIHSDMKIMAAALGSNTDFNPNKLSVTRTPDNQLIDTSSNLNLNGNMITNVKAIVGADNRWEIDAFGRMVTRIATDKGTASLYALQSKSDEIVLSGSGQLQNGTAVVEFDELDQAVIDPSKPIRVTVTLTEDADSVYVTEKDETGFTVRERGNGQSDATFDWVVVAQKIAGNTDPIEVSEQEADDESNQSEDEEDEEEQGSSQQTAPEEESDSNQQEVVEEQDTAPEEGDGQQEQEPSQEGDSGEQTDEVVPQEEEPAGEESTGTQEGSQEEAGQSSDQPQDSGGGDEVVQPEPEPQPAADPQTDSGGESTEPPQQTE